MSLQLAKEAISEFFMDNCLEEILCRILHLTDIMERGLTSLRRINTVLSRECVTYRVAEDLLDN